MREYVADQLYFSTVQIEGNLATGTAFFYIYDFGGFGKNFLVTNRHVVEKSQNGILKFHLSSHPFPNKNLVSNQNVTLNLNDSQWSSFWKFHPNPNVDIAILDFTEIEVELDKRKQHVYYKALNNNSLIKSDDYADISSIEQICFVGYPKGITDNHNLLPIARHGFTASPMKYDFNGKKEFLIDAAVFPGSSGSPVCIINEGLPFIDRNNTLRLDVTRFIFLGVLSSVNVEKDQENEDLVKHYLNLGVVIKGECINETIIHHFTIRP